jgi:undecaprenyl diphosphate synthase
MPSYLPKLRVPTSLSSSTKKREEKGYSKPATSSKRRQDFNSPPVQVGRSVENVLPNSISLDPRHIAIVCDGNSRWATNQKNESAGNAITAAVKKCIGHSKGASRVISTVKYLDKVHPDVKHVTIYGFSTENWSRPDTEIRDIWNVIESTAINCRDWALREGIVVKILGDLDDDRIPIRARTSLEKLERDSHSMNQRKKIDGIDASPFTLCIAVNYGGKRDIINASKKIVDLIKRGEMQEGDINEETFSNLLCTSDIPDPDLLIRTGGEQRLSNFLIWNCAYAEMYFTKVLWPDFDENEIESALHWYRSQDRRFGGRNIKDNREFS